MASVPFAFLVGLLRSRLSRAAAVSDLVARLGEADRRQRPARRARRGARRSVAVARLLGAGPGALRRRRGPAGRAAGARTATDACTPVEHEGRPVAMICHDAIAGRRARARAGASAPPPRWRSRTSGSTSSCARGSRSCALRGRGSSRPPTTSAAGSSATSTTAPSSGWSRSRSTCASPARSWTTDPAGGASSCSTRRPSELERGDDGAARARARPAPGGAQRPRPRARRSRRSPAARRCRSSSARLAGERLPEPVESASYFVVAEALTNVARYAQRHRTPRSASSARNGARRGRGRATTASAAPIRDAGSGLRGLADRVAALDGRLEVVSPRGRRDRRSGR